MSKIIEKDKEINRKKMNKVQLNRLQNMVDYCIKNVPFYKEKLKESGINSGKQIKNLEDISKLPFTTKQDIKDNYPDGLLAVPMEKVVRIQGSSGTTGKSKISFYTKKDLEVWIDCAARLVEFTGATSKDVVQISCGYGMFSGGLGFHYGAEKVGCTIIPASTLEKTNKQIDFMRDLNTTMLIAIPSYVIYLIETIEKLNIPFSDFKIDKMIIGGERTTKGMRKTIEEKLNCKIFNAYGLTECFGAGLAGECKCHNGMHICEEVFYPEIINPETGEVLKDGEQGELVFTSLQREAWPILRYRTGDITTITHEKCECGSILVRMEAPFARVDDMFILKGVNVYPTQIETIIDNIEGISTHYLIKLEKKEKDNATLYIELEKEKKEYKEQEIEKIYKEIKEKIKGNINVSIDLELVEPNTLTRTSGKTKRVEDLRYVGEIK